MTYVAAFDDTPLSRAALERAREFSRATDEEVVAVTCVPDSSVRARERGWVEGEYDLQTVLEGLRRAVTDIAPEAEFRYEVVGGSAPEGAVSGRLRRVVKEVEPDVLFVGSERAGTAATPIGSVAGTLIAAGDYDVFLVREAE